jgi:hypothetical protein
MRFLLALVLAAAIGGILWAGSTAAAPDQTLGAALMSAVVDADGTLVRGGGATSVMRVANGTYVVTFSRSVVECTYVASLGLTGTNNIPPSGSASVVARVPNIVLVVTTDSTGSNVDTAFHLIVFCTQ